MSATSPGREDARCAGICDEWYGVPGICKTHGFILRPPQPNTQYTHPLLFLRKLVYLVHIYIYIHTKSLQNASYRLQISNTSSLSRAL